MTIFNAVVKKSSNSAPALFLCKQNILDVFIQSRHPNPLLCEDVIALFWNEDNSLKFAAVIDGATDKSGVSYGGVTGGRFAASTLANELSTLPSSVEGISAINILSEALNKAVLAADQAAPEHCRPTANMVIFSPYHNEVWRVGDCHFAFKTLDEFITHLGVMPVDEVSSMARSAHTQCLLAEGYTVQELATTDPGRALILPLLQHQGALANADPALPFSFGVMDGRVVPREFIEIYKIPANTTELILASDGYLEVCSDRKEAEDILSSSLQSDPLRIGKYASTKALAPGSLSFDDRSWIQISLKNKS